MSLIFFCGGYQVFETVTVKWDGGSGTETFALPMWCGQVFIQLGCLVGGITEIGPNEKV